MHTQCKCEGTEICKCGRENQLKVRPVYVSLLFTWELTGPGMEVKKKKETSEVLIMSQLVCH